MKGTNTFKQIIQAHLNDVASKDSSFAQSLKKTKKNIDDCINYILSTVQKSGCNGFEDDEIFGMAMHYYDEDDIKIGNPIKAKVVVNHSVGSTQEVAKKKSTLKKSKTEPLEQLSMF